MVIIYNVWQYQTFEFYFLFLRKNFVNILILPCGGANKSEKPEVFTVNVLKEGGIL